jgi:ubiquinone/menaquinone biosynthesis C-methylase UbiE
MHTQTGAQAAAEQKLVNSRFEELVSEWAEVYERQGLDEFIFQERMRIVLEMVGRLGLHSQSRVLEIGCGAGLYTLALAKLGYLVDAIDPVQKMVDATHERVRQSGQERRVRSNLGDVRTLGFQDETFDLVLAVGVLPWLSSIEQPLHEMYRVTRLGGYLITTVNNRWALQQVLDPLTNPMLHPAKTLAKRLLRRRPKARPRVVALGHFDTLLDATGFDKVESLTLGFGPFSVFGCKLLPSSIGLKLHCRLQAAAERGFPLLRASGSKCVVLAKKYGG